MIDIGANLAHESFAADLDAVLERAWSAGLDAIIVTGSSRDSAREALRLAQAYPGKLYATAGLHPHQASDWDAAHAALFRELAAQPQLVALGECGLDYFRDLSPRATQREAFIAQIELAVELEKPLFLHQRDAHEDFAAILREYRAQLVDVVVHCYTGTAAALEEYLALDCHVGITGWICDERRGLHLLDAVKLIPDARLLIETDAPYLLPRGLPKPQRPRDGRRNEPMYLPYVARKIAEARGQSEVEIAGLTSANAKRFFRL